MTQIRRHISLDEETDEKLQALAERDHKNVSQWITGVVWEKMKSIPGKKPAKVINLGLNTNKFCHEN